jgi:hypothetical protein
MSEPYPIEKIRALHDARQAEAEARERLRGVQADHALYEKHPECPTLMDVFKAEGIKVRPEFGDRISLHYPDGHVEYRALTIEPGRPER